MRYEEIEPMSRGDVESVLERDSAARPVIEAGLRDSNDYVRGQAHAAADDAELFLGWTIVRPNWPP